MSPLQRLKEWKQRRDAAKGRGGEEDPKDRFRGSWRQVATNQDVHGREKACDPAGEWEEEAWDLDPDTSLTTLGGHGSEIYALAFAPNAERMVTGCNVHAQAGGNTFSDLKFWHFRAEEALAKKSGRRVDLDDGEMGPICETVSHPGQVLDCDYSPTGRHVVTACSDENAYIYSVHKGRALLHKLRGHMRKVYSAKFTPTGSSCPGEIVATASMDSTLRIWDAETGTQCGILATARPLYTAAFNATGTALATAGHNADVMLWDWRSDRAAQCLRAHSDAVWSVQFSSDDHRLVTGGMGDELMVWDTRILRTIWRVRDAHGGTAVHRCVFSPDGQHVVSAGRDKKLRVWDAEEGHHQDVMSGHRKTVFNVCFHPAGDRLLSASNDQTVKIWRFPPARNGQEMAS